MGYLGQYEGSREVVFFLKKVIVNFLWLFLYFLLLFFFCLVRYWNFFHMFRLLNIPQMTQSEGE